MPRIIVLDYNVINQLNRGSEKTAAALKRLIDSGAKIYISQQAYQEATSQPGKMVGGVGPDLPRVAVANQMLIDDLSIKVTQPGVLDQAVVDRNTASPTLSQTDVMTVAQAKALQAELGQRVEVWSFDKAFRNNPGNIENSFGVKVAPESQTAYETSERGPDYQVARRLMGLKTDFEISVGGNVQKKPSKKPPSGGSGGGTGGHSGTGSDISMPDTGPPDLGQSGARGQKIGDAFELGLRGVNFIIQSINDSIQADRMAKEWAAIKPDIERAVAENPSRGVLIIVRFGRREKQGAEHETPLEHTARFLSIDTEYGLTESEAWDAYVRRPRLRAETGLKVTHQRVFIEPKKPVDVKKLRTPFTAYGIGTFATTHASLMRVAWKGVFGFDEVDDVKLEVPKGVIPRFLLLVAPNEIEFRNGAAWHSTHVAVDWQDAASAATHYTKPISVVDMDRGLFNVGDDTAAMIFPADDATARLFDGVARMRDNLGQLKSFTNIEKLRWARPRHIHVLSKFMEDMKIKSEKPIRFAPKEPALRR